MGLRVGGGVGEGIARLPSHGDLLRIEHPTGFLDIEAALDHRAGATPAARRTVVVRTARKIFDGTVFARPAAAAAHL